MLSAASGHTVTSPLLATIGNDDKLVAFAANTLLMVGPMTSPLPHTIPSGLHITALSLHPEKPLLLCGTRESGLFLLPASEIVFSSEHQLPLPAGSTSVVCCHFLAAGPRTLFVCCMQGKAAHSTTAIIGDALSKATLWMSYSADMDMIAPFPGTQSFASCNKKDVAIWHCTIQQGPAATKVQTARPTTSLGPPRKEVVEVKQKICDTIAELKGAEFVAVAVPPAKDAQSILALTTAGFLVCFGKADGCVQKWMDCKVCPSTCVLATLRHVIVCGAACRFFTMSSWDFVGKVKVEAFSGGRSVTQSFLSDLFHSLCVTGTATEVSATLFFGNGAMTTFSLDANAKGRLALTPTAKHLSFDQARECTWVPAAKGLVALWTASDLRLLSEVSLMETASASTELAALTRHAAVGCFIGYDSQGGELVALDELTLVVKAKAHAAEPLVSLTHLQEGRLVGLAPNNTLHFYAASRDDDQLTLKFDCQRLLPANQAVSALCYASATLCGVAASTLHNIGAGSSFQLPSPIHCFTTTEDRVILSHGCSISVVEPSSFRVHQIDFGAPAAEIRVHPGLRHIAVRTRLRSGESVISVVDAKRGSGAVVGKLSLACNVKAFGFSGEGALAVADDKGVLSRWSIFDKASVLLLPLEAQGEKNDVAATKPPMPDAGRRRATSALREDQRKKFAELDALAQQTVRRRHADVNSSGLLFGGSEVALTGLLQQRPKWDAVDRAGGFAFPQIGSVTGSTLQGETPTLLGSEAATRNITIREVTNAPSQRSALPMPSAHRPQLVSPLEEAEISPVTAPKQPPVISPTPRGAMTAVLALPDDEDVTQSAAAALLAQERARVRDSELLLVEGLGRGSSPHRKGDEAASVAAVKAAQTDDDDDAVLISSTDGHAATQQGYAPVVFAPNFPSNRDEEAKAEPRPPVPAEAPARGTRESVAQWLAQTCRRIEDDSVTDDEAMEIASAVADVITAIQVRAQRRPESGASSGRSPLADRIGGSVATSTGTLSQFNVVWAEMQRLREQSDRIESQNKSILQAIARLSTDRAPS